MVMVEVKIEVQLDVVLVSFTSGGEDEAGENQFTRVILMSPEKLRPECSSVGRCQ